MRMFLGFFGVILLVAVVVGWYWLYRRSKGEVGPLFGSSNKDRGGESSSELEAFIAAYRGGKLNPTELTSLQAVKSAPAQPPARTAPVPLRPPAAADSAAATPSATGHEPGVPALLRPEVKLAYLTLRAGLRDHHVFPSIRLSDMGRGAVAGKVDLLVCDASFQLIAAIDVFSAGNQPDAAKMTFLREAGIRYLKFSIGSMPKPADVRALIYRA